jgi:hypothetical protein
MKGTCERAAENGASGGCFRRPFHCTPTRRPRRFKLTPPSFDGFEPLRCTLTFSPLPSPPRKRPILAPRPLTLKWTSLDLLRVMVRGICGTLFPPVHRPHFLTHPPSLRLAVYFLCSPTRVFNHEITIPSCRSLHWTVPVRREEIGGTRLISKGWLAFIMLWRGPGTGCALRRLAPHSVVPRRPSFLLSSSLVSSLE